MTNESETLGPAAAARAIFDAAGRRDLDALSARYRDDVVIEWVPAGTFRGKQAVRDFWAEIFGAVPDSRLELLNLICEADFVVGQWRWRGTFTGTPYLGVHATGKPVDFRGCDVMRFVDGLLAEETVYFDGLGWARQIGMLPGEGTIGDKAMRTAFNAQTDAVAAVRQWLQKRK